MPPRFEIVATFERERHVFHNEGGDTRVIIGEGVIVDPGDGTETAGNPITVKGEAREGALKCGLDYRFFGRDIEHPKHGKQFAFTSFTLQEPAGKKAVTVYLQQIPGIGMVVANRLWEKYGNRATKALRELPEVCAAEIKGLSESVAEYASEFLEDNFATERAKMDLLELLKGRGFPKKTIDSVIRDFGSAGAERIRNNPYILMRYRGCGFIGCDKLYMDLKKPAGALKRQALCMWHGVAKAGRSSGDTWFSANVARSRLASEIAGADIKTERAMELAVRGGILTTRESMGSLWIAEDSKAHSEERVAEAIATMMVENADWPDIEPLRPVLRGEDGGSHQFDQLKVATTGTLGILTGSPGTGKTYTVAALIRMLLKEGWTRDEIAVCAPTGKAAVRITETLQDMGVPLVATTIHTLLGVASAEGGGWHFTCGRNNKLQFKWIVGDEWSMVDTGLNASFFDAIGEGTHVILSGDTKQLPPVGHGAPLRDMIDAGVPTGRLTEIRRNSGQIVRCCREIKDNKRFLSSAKLDVASGENLLHIELDDPEQQIAAMTKLISQVKAGAKFDPVWDVQVLCAVNKKSPLSRHELNRRLQILLNENGPPVKGTFQVGDKIVNTKNSWLKSLYPIQDGANKDGKVYVANGEQAEVLVVDPGKITARLWSPDRTVVIPRGQQEDDESESEKDGDDAGAEESGNDKPPSTGCAWELGYAISVHKSQGSEWPIVIAVIDDHNAARMVQTSNWIYTGISRAKEFCVTLGQRRVIQEMLRRDGMNRKTFLRELIETNVSALDKIISHERKRITQSVDAFDWDELLDGVLGDASGLLDGVVFTGAGSERCPF